MQNQFISKDKVFTQTSKFTEILIHSNGYSNFHDNVLNSDTEYSDEKTYEIVSSGFVDFNQDLYEDINQMNSISTGLYIEMSLVTYRIFIWSAKGEGFEIFKHVLRGEEISNLKTIEDIKEYLYTHINELEQGIVNTYGQEVSKCFEQFGIAIESRQLPLNSILQYLTIENNINDFR